MATGYGVDTWCADSLVTGRLDSGPGLVLRAIYRRYITPRGTLRGGDDEEVYGFDLSSYVGSTDAEIVLRTLPALMQAEALKDDRVVTAVATVAREDSPDGTISIVATVRIRLAGELTDFALTLGISEVTTRLLGIQEAA